MWHFAQVVNNSHAAAKLNEQADDFEDIADKDKREVTSHVELLGSVKTFDLSSEDVRSCVVDTRGGMMLLQCWDA